MKSVCLAQSNVLKDYSIVEKDKKLNDDTMQDVVDRPKYLSPPDLLKSLIGSEGHALWDIVVDVSLCLFLIMSRSGLTLMLLPSYVVGSQVVFNPYYFFVVCGNPV